MTFCEPLKDVTKYYFNYLKLELKGAKAPAIPFKNKNNVLYFSLPLSPSLSLYLSLSLSL